MTNEKFLAFLGGQTDATSQRLQSFVGAIGAISPDLTEGFQDLIANAGVPVTEAALALIQNMPEAEDTFSSRLRHSVVPISSCAIVLPRYY